MSIPPLVETFYARIWNAGDETVVPEILADDFAFRGSLGTPVRGHAAFLDYVRSVRGSLADYQAEILGCVTEGEQAFARMRFSGLHVAPLRGFAPTNARVSWEAAAVFTFQAGKIASLWVLGDLPALDAQLPRGAGPVTVDFTFTDHRGTETPRNSFQIDL